jgi:hypothetical protein
MVTSLLCVTNLRRAEQVGQPWRRRTFIRLRAAQDAFRGPTN